MAHIGQKVGLHSVRGFSGNLLGLIDQKFFFEPLTLMRTPPKSRHGTGELSDLVHALLVRQIIVIVTGVEIPQALDYLPKRLHVRSNRSDGSCCRGRTQSIGGDGLQQRLTV